MVINEEFLTGEGWGENSRLTIPHFLQGHRLFKGLIKRMVTHDPYNSHDPLLQAEHSPNHKRFKSSRNNSYQIVWNNVMRFCIESSNFNLPRRRSRLIFPFIYSCATKKANDFFSFAIALILFSSSPFGDKTSSSSSSPGSWAFHIIVVILDNDVGLLFSFHSSLKDAVDK